ncbi:MAG: Lrp/AsnC ligand binding domain-containing protein [Candidatus Saliniplasma sp.]
MEPITAIVLIDVNEDGKVNEIARQLLKIDEVTEVHSVAGIYDIVTKVKVKEYGSLSEVVTEKVRAIEGIEETLSMPCFKTYKL